MCSNICALVIHIAISTSLTKCVQKHNDYIFYNSNTNYHGNNVMMHMQ